MTGTMKAAVLRTIGTLLKIETLPIPEPGPGEVLIKVHACGVCHSDLHAVEGDWIAAAEPSADPWSRGGG